MDANTIFDALATCANIVHIENEIRQKRIQIRSVEDRRCGNCALWMTRKCEPEAIRGQFKSMNSMACPQFQMSPAASNLAERFRGELKTICDQLP